MCDAVQPVVADFIDAGFLTYQHHSWPVSETDVPLAAIACLAEHGHKHRWMGFINFNEYIALKDKANIVAVLESHQSFAAVQILRQSISAVDATSQDLILSSHTQCLPNTDSQRPTSIVQTQYATLVGHTADTQYAAGFRALTFNYATDTNYTNAQNGEHEVVLYHYDFGPALLHKFQTTLHNNSSSTLTLDAGMNVFSTHQPDVVPATCGMLQNWWRDHSDLRSLMPMSGSS